MPNLRHEIGDTILIKTADNSIALKQGSDMIFISIDELKEIAKTVDEVLR
jgi:hypothetical protein